MATQNKFGPKTKALEVVEGVNLKGKEIIVTGGAGGIGVETVRALAKTGARVVIAARDLKRANEVAEDIRKTTGNSDIEVEELELGSLKSIRAFVSRYLAKNIPLHVLINNAGVMRTPEGKTEDGFETQFGVNHVGHFALTIGLLPALKTAKGARVINVSSIGHTYGDVNLEDPNFRNRPYDPIASYGQSKTANILFSVGLTKRYSNDGIYSNALMPGGIMTGLQKYVTEEQRKAEGWSDENEQVKAGFKSIEEGASTTVWAAVASELEGRGGLYLEDCQIMSETTKEAIQEAFSSNFKNGLPRGYLAYAVDPVKADKLWQLTEKLIEEASK